MGLFWGFLLIFGEIVGKVLLVLGGLGGVLQFLEDTIPGLLFREDSIGAGFR